MNKIIRLVLCSILCLSAIFTCSDLFAYSIAFDQLFSDKIEDGVTILNEYSQPNDIFTSIRMEAEFWGQPASYSSGSASAQYNFSILNDSGQSNFAELTGYFERMDCGGQFWANASFEYSILDDKGVEIFNRSNTSECEFYTLSLETDVVYTMNTHLELSLGFVENYQFIDGDLTTALYFLELAEGEAPEPVPEPSTIMLLGMGLFSFFRLKKPKIFFLKIKSL